MTEPQQQRSAGTPLVTSVRIGPLQRPNKRVEFPFHKLEITFRAPAAQLPQADIAHIFAGLSDGLGPLSYNPDPDGSLKVIFPVKPERLNHIRQVFTDAPELVDNSNKQKKPPRNYTKSEKEPPQTWQQITVGQSTSVSKADLPKAEKVSSRQSPIFQYEQETRLRFDICFPRPSSSPLARASSESIDAFIDYFKQECAKLHNGPLEARVNDKTVRTPRPQVSITFRGFTDQEEAKALLDKINKKKLILPRKNEPWLFC